MAGPEKHWVLLHMSVSPQRLVQQNSYEAECNLATQATHATRHATTQTSHADLNGFLLQMETNIADFAAELGCTALEQQYRQLAANRWAGHLLHGSLRPVRKCSWQPHSQVLLGPVALQSCPPPDTGNSRRAPICSLLLPLCALAAMCALPAGATHSTCCSGTTRPPR